MTSFKKNFGVTKDLEDVTAYTIENKNKMKLTALNYGCTIQSLFVPNNKNKLTDVVIGYDTISEYEQNSGFLGAAIGRMANRIGKGEFLLNDTKYHLFCNDGKNHLHGGKKGFDKCMWMTELKENSIHFSRCAPNMEEGYPGNLTCHITYTLTNDNMLIIDYNATCDTDTIINLTNHSYFNLSGEDTIYDHLLQINASKFTEIDSECIPTGTLKEVNNSPFDFSKLKFIKSDIFSDHIQLKNGCGYDHNFVLSDDAKLKDAAILISQNSGIQMNILTTEPGIQFYSGNSLTKRAGKNGNHIDFRGALCLETQKFPDSMAHVEFPSPVLKVGQIYQSQTMYKFSLLDNLS